MTIKQSGGIFGRNPTFNDVTIEGELTFDGDIDVNSDLKVSGDIEASRLGINTDPAHDIHIKNATAAEIKMEDTGSATAHSIIADGIGLSLRADSAYNDVINVLGGAAHQIVFRTNGADAFIVDAAGNIAFTAGKGIDFSATSGTGTSELFDDYEEGTWTPVYATTGTNFDSVTYDSLTAGRYVKIGNVVHISGYIRTDALDATSATGTVLISGLPFATAVVNSDTKSMGAIATSRAQNFNGMSGFPFLHPRSGFSYMYLLDGDRLDVPVAEMSTGANTNIVAFAGTYITE